MSENTIIKGKSQRLLAGIREYKGKTFFQIAQQYADGKDWKHSPKSVTLPVSKESLKFLKQAYLDLKAAISEESEK